MQIIPILEFMSLEVTEIMCLFRIPSIFLMLEIRQTVLCFSSIFSLNYLSGQGCSITFADDEFSQDGRDAVYYVRAIQVESNAVGGDPLRCEFDENGECIKIKPCYASGPEFDPSDDCLAPIGERAWSSPIFLNYLN